MLTSLLRLLASALDPGGSVAASSGVPTPSPAAWPAGRHGTGPSDNAIGSGAGTAVFFARTSLVPSEANPCSQMQVVISATKSALQGRGSRRMDRVTYTPDGVATIWTSLRLVLPSHTALIRSFGLSLQVAHDLLSKHGHLSRIG